MAAIRPPQNELTGTYIRVAPLLINELPELYSALGSPEVFAGGWGGGPHGHQPTEADFVAFARDYFTWEQNNVYGIRLVGGPDAGTLVGTSTLGDFDEANEHAHIGWTAWDPRIWATAVNPEAKLLMLGHAFDHGFGRVKLQADELNARSRAAIARLGATFEGIVRRDRRRADGSWRGTAVFSILVDEWPDVQSALQRRLEAFEGRPVRLSVETT